MPEGVHKAAIIYWARRNYGHFRGYADEEIDVTYNEDGSVSLYGYKESNK